MAATSCLKTHHLPASYTGILSHLDAVPRHVWFAGLCRHMYKSHILGLAGSFSQGQLADLKRCLPADCIDYVEADVKVPV